jgi:hypothetical protein
MKLGVLSSFVFLLSLAAPFSNARAQSPIMTVTLGPDQIGVVKSAQGLTTRLAFPDAVTEIVCGDLYDPTSGKGSFVVQRSDKDVYIKPIAAGGASNLFVKTGEKGERVYNFDLLIVPFAQANRVIHVKDPAPRRQPVAEDPAPQKSEEIINDARQKAGRIIAEAEQRAGDIDRKAYDRARLEAKQRFTRALIMGLREAKISAPRALAKGCSITVDPRVLTFDGVSYLRFTLQNSGTTDFAFTAIVLEKGAGNLSAPIPTEVSQSRGENIVKPGEALLGVIAFDPRLVGPKDKLTLYVRGGNSAELARINIAQ